MIIDRIENIGRYAGAHERFSAAFAYLDKLIAEGAADGKHVLEGTAAPEEIFVNISTNENKVHTAAITESHELYIDVQLVMEGTEVMYAPATAMPQADFKKNDTQMYEGMPFSDCHRLVIPAGHFAIFFAGELHAPGVSVSDKPTAVRKAVLKVLA